MKVNLEKVKEVVIKDQSGKVIERFVLIASCLELPEYLLILQKGK